MQEAKKETWPNNVFEIFMGNHSIFSPSITKLRKNLGGKEAYDLEKYIVKIIESIECKAYLNRKKEIIDAFNDKQSKIKDVKKRKAPTIENMPELQQLIIMESGFSIEKKKIGINKFLPDLSPMILKKLDAENAKHKPDMSIIERLEEQLQQERNRILTGEDFAILRQFFEFED